MQQPAKTHWGAVIIALAAGVIAAAHYGKAPTALPEIRSEIPISLVIGGWIMSVFSVAGMTLGIATGTLADRLGARELAMLGLGALGLGSLVGGMAGSGETLLLSRGIEGFGFIAVAVSAPILIVRASTPEELPLSLGLWTTYMPVGMALAMLITPLMVAAMGWRAFWILASAIALVWLLLVGSSSGNGHRARPPVAPPEHGLLENILLTIRSPGAWLLSIGFSFYTLQWISLMAWLPSFMVEQRGLSLELTGLLTALVVALNIPGNLTVGWLLRRGLTRSGILIVSGSGLGLSALGIFNDALSDLSRLLCCLSFSYFGGMTPGTILSGAPAVAPTRGQIGTVNGMMVQGSHIGQLLGPPALAALATLTGDWQQTRWLMLAGAGGIIVIALLFRRLAPATTGKQQLSGSLEEKA